MVSTYLHLGELGSYSGNRFKKKSKVSQTVEIGLKRSLKSARLTVEIGLTSICLKSARLTVELGLKRSLKSAKLTMETD